MLPHHYQLLGVHRSSTPAELKDAYYALARQHHPDKGGDASLFAAIAHAYRVLNNAGSQKAYVDKLAMYGQPCVTCVGSGVVTEQISFTHINKYVCSTCHGCGIQLRTKDDN